MGVFGKMWMEKKRTEKNVRIVNFLLFFFKGGLEKQHVCFIVRARGRERGREREGEREGEERESEEERVEQFWLRRRAGRSGLSRLVLCSLEVERSSPLTGHQHPVGSEPIRAF